MKRTLIWVLVVLVVVVLAATFSSRPDEADVVLTNGVIFTVDEELGRAEALAVKDGKIAAVGTSQEIQEWVGSETRVIDLEGKFVVPGFNDNHVHVGGAAGAKMRIDVEGTRSIAEFQQRIRDRLEEFEAGQWITGRGWDHSLWEENRVPTKADLDAVSTEHPMLFTRVDGHSAVANSMALQMAEITRDTPNPEGGDIVRDAEGEPTGWLKERATGLVSRLIPDLTPEQLRAGLEQVLQDAARHGVTSVQGNSGWDTFLALRELKNEGKLTFRYTHWLPFNTSLDRLEQLRREGGTTDPWLKTGAVKGVVDGSGGSLSAAMLEPFANAPDNRGILLYDPEELKKMVIDRDAAGYQIALHAIGDRANRVCLDAFQAAKEVNKRENARHKIEHSQFVQRDDVPRFAELGVIASAQPCHMLADLRWAPTILGPEREYEGYPWNSLQKAGAVVSFGTDHPVEHINPLRGIYAAVAREFEAGGPEGGWLPEEKITVEEAIRAYTLRSAYGEFEDHRKGTLTPGKFADLVLLSQDITQVSPPEILQTEVLLTMVGGRIVYEKQ